MLVEAKERARAGAADEVALRRALRATDMGDGKCVRKIEARCESGQVLERGEEKGASSSEE